MRLFSQSVSIACLTLLLAACSGVNTVSTEYPFPTAMPSGAVLDSQYQALKHDLSPLPQYRFRIQIPNDWKTLDTKIEKEPAKDALADVAVFRQPGVWMKDPTAAINGEVSVSVVNVSGSTLSPADWLQKILQKNVKGFVTLNKRSSPSAPGEVPDVLIKYTAGNDTIISRMMAFKSGNRMFVITGSDTAKEYPQNAEAFNVAISTFRLDSAGK